MRWHNPMLGQVSPDKFIGVAEDSGLILHAGRVGAVRGLRPGDGLAARRACRRLHRGGQPVAAQFHHADLPSLVQRGAGADRPAGRAAWSWS